MKNLTSIVMFAALAAAADPAVAQSPPQGAAPPEVGASRHRPRPPGPQPKPTEQVGTMITQPGLLNALNPQPLPPKDGGKLIASVKHGDHPNALNPQPLPPSDGGGGVAQAAKKTPKLNAMNRQPLSPSPR